MGRDTTADVLEVDQLALAIEAIQDAILVFDDQARLVIVNDKLLAATGYDREDLVGGPALALLPAAVRAEVAERMAAYARAPVPRALGDGLVSSILRKDGSTFEARIANSPVTTASGNMVVMTIRAVQHLSLEEIQFRGLLDASPDAMLICNTEGHVVLSNTSATRLFEHEQVALFNQPLVSLFPDGQVPALSQWLAEYCETSGDDLVLPDVPSVDLEVLRRDGSVVPVEVSVSSMPTVDGPTLRVVVRDISERQRQQREAEAKKDGFLATVSHELRTPLTSVLGYGELLEDLGNADLSEHARNLLGVVLRNARRELRLVDDLLTMVQIGEGAFRMRPGQVNFSELVLHAVEAAAPVAQRAGVHVSFVKGGEDAFVAGDADRLGQAVDNLLTNSIKFSPISGEVAVAMSTDAESVTVSVVNEGEGIRATDVSHVFDRLYRGSNAVVAEKQGVGLGLSIVRSIVEAHQGKVSAACTGSTTCFEVTLPRAARSISVPGQRPREDPDSQ